MAAAPAAAGGAAEGAKEEAKEEEPAEDSDEDMVRMTNPPWTGRPSYSRQCVHRDWVSSIRVASLVPLVFVNILDFLFPLCYPLKYLSMKGKKNSSWSLLEICDNVHSMIQVTTSICQRRLRACKTL